MNAREAYRELAGWERGPGEPPPPINGMTLGEAVQLSRRSHQCLCRGVTVRQVHDGISWLRCTRCGLLAAREVTDDPRDDLR
jgi:hypothetical protein